MVLEDQTYVVALFEVSIQQIDVLSTILTLFEYFILNIPCVVQKYTNEIEIGHTWSEISLYTKNFGFQKSNNQQTVVKYVPNYRKNELFQHYTTPSILLFK